MVTCKCNCGNTHETDVLLLETQSRNVKEIRVSTAYGDQVCFYVDEFYKKEKQEQIYFNMKAPELKKLKDFIEEQLKVIKNAD